MTFFFSIANILEIKSFKECRMMCGSFSTNSDLHVSHGAASTCTYITTNDTALRN